MSYTVIVHREGNQWLAEVDGMPGGHAYARNLLTLDKEIHDVISLILDHDDAEATAFAGQPLQYVYKGQPGAVTDAAKLGQARRQALTLSPAVSECARELAADGYTVRDIAHLLAVTPGYVSQVTSRPPLAQAA